MGSSYIRSDKPTPMQPLPISQFEKEFVTSVMAIAAALPPGTADISVSRVPGHEEWDVPYFELTPTNPFAATISGWAAKNDLNMSIGEAAHREFVGFGRGGTVLKGQKARQEFEAMCSAVIKGGFTEHLAFNSKGKLLYSEAFLNVQDTIIEFGIKPWLGIRWKSHANRERTYQAYT
jgi:hypothetical protein